MIAGIIVKIVVAALVLLVVAALLLFRLNSGLEDEVEHSYEDRRNGYDPKSIRFLASSMRAVDEQEGQYLSDEERLRRFLKQNCERKTNKARAQNPAAARSLYTMYS